MADREGSELVSVTTGVWTYDGGSESGEEGSGSVLGDGGLEGRDHSLEKQSASSSGRQPHLVKLVCQRV